MITDFIVLILSLSYLSFKQILFSLIAVTISGKIISIMYGEDGDNDVDKSLQEEFASTKEI